MNVAAAALNSPAQPLCLCSLALKRQVLEADHDPSMDCSRNMLLSLHGLLNTFPVLFILRNMNQPLLTPSLFMRPATSGSDHHLPETAFQATPRPPHRSSRLAFGRSLRDHLVLGSRNRIL